MDKKDIIGILEEIATILEIKGENPFKTRAYTTGARILQTLEEDLGTLVEDGRLGEIKGIGKALEEKIGELYTTGKLGYYENLKNSIPTGLLEMLDIPGMGGKKIKALHDALGVDSIDSLTQACESGQVAPLKGFGEKSQKKILDGIRNREAYSARHLWWKARGVADRILPGLRELPEVERAEAAGSLRRGMETVGDLDFLVASTDPAPIMDWFTSQEGIVEVTAKGDTKSSIRLEDGLQADLRVIPPKQFFFALHYFTGSKDHNILMRQRALDKGLHLSEWGLRTDDEQEKARGEGSIEANCEEDIFSALGLQYIPPELREGSREVEAAGSEKALPQLVTLKDLRGCFHNHTVASDGNATLEDMVRAAEEKGWEYLGISDHSKSSFQANGLDEGRLANQIEAIHRLNASGDFGTHVLAGSEVDILNGGRLDFDDSLLAQLDYVVASVHAGLNQDEETLTNRIIKAIENPHVTMLGHMTGRLLLRREPGRVNIPKVIDAAIANRTIIELNANPQRLDMDWRHWRKAAEKGLLCSINPDAHDTWHFNFLQTGILSARKGWLTPENILNTWQLEKVLAYLGKK